MLGSLFKFVVMVGISAVVAVIVVAAVGISAVVAVIVVAAFDDYYQDLEARRHAKWARKHSQENHPSNSGPRYE